MKEKIHLGVNIAIFRFQTTSMHMTVVLKRNFKAETDELFMNQFAHQSVNAVLLPAYLCWNLKINLLNTYYYTVLHIIAYNPGPCLYY